MRAPLRYALGGAATYGFKTLLSAALVELGVLVFRYAYALSATAVVIFSFWYNRKITFASSGRIGAELPRYVFALGVFYAADYLMTVLLVESAGVDYVTAISIVTLSLFVLKYPAFRFVVFRGSRACGPSPPGVSV